MTSEQKQIAELQRTVKLQGEKLAELIDKFNLLSLRQHDAAKRSSRGLDSLHQSPVSIEAPETTDDIWCRSKDRENKPIGH